LSGVLAFSRKSIKSLALRRMRAFAEICCVRLLGDPSGFCPNATSPVKHKRILWQLRAQSDRPLLAGQRPYEVADRTRALDFGLLCHLQRIVDFDSEVANRTFQFRVPKQQ